jgi:predicted phage tail protein
VKVKLQGLKRWALESIFLDNTPLQNPDGTFNFQNVTVYTRNGTQNQDAIPFAGEIEDERAVGVTVRNDGPVTRTITDSQTDAVRITISVPRLEFITNEGDTVGESFRLQIQIQYNGGGFSTVIDDTVSGRTGDPYQKAYLVNLGWCIPRGCAAWCASAQIAATCAGLMSSPGPATPRSSTAASPTPTAH